MMEEDKLLRFHERLKEFIQKRITLLLNIVLGFVILIILAGAWVYYQKNREKKAYDELVQLLHKQSDIKALEAFAKKNAGTQAGIQATLILWENLVQNNDIVNLKEKLRLMEKIYPAKLKNLLLYSEAKILEDMGKKEEALKIYEKLRNKEDSLKEIVLLDQARLLETKNREEALKLYQEIQKGDPNFYGQSLASYKIFQLKKQ